MSSKSATHEGDSVCYMSVGGGPRGRGRSGERDAHECRCR